MEYRTDEQWNEICDSAVNGNWSQACQECVDYGFFANDLLKKQQEEFDLNDFNVLEWQDLAILAEGAMKIRWDKQRFDS